MHAPTHIYDMKKYKVRLDVFECIYLYIKWTLFYNGLRNMRVRCVDSIKTIARVICLMCTQTTQ